MLQFAQPTWVLGSISFPRSRQFAQLASILGDVVSPRGTHQLAQLTWVSGHRSLLSAPGGRALLSPWSVDRPGHRSLLSAPGGWPSLVAGLPRPLRMPMAPRVVGDGPVRRSLLPAPCGVAPLAPMVVGGGPARRCLLPSPCGEALLYSLLVGGGGPVRWCLLPAPCGVALLPPMAAGCDGLFGRHPRPSGPGHPLSQSPTATRAAGAHWSCTGSGGLLGRWARALRLGPGGAPLGDVRSVSGRVAARVGQRRLLVHGRWAGCGCSPRCHR